MKAKDDLTRRAYSEESREPFVTGVMMTPEEVSWLQLPQGGSLFRGENCGYGSGFAPAYRACDVIQVLSGAPQQLLRLKTCMLPPKRAGLASWRSCPACRFWWGRRRRSIQGQRGRD